MTCIECDEELQPYEKEEGTCLLCLKEASEFYKSETRRIECLLDGQRAVSTALH